MSNYNLIYEEFKKLIKEEKIIMPTYGIDWSKIKVEPYFTGGFISSKSIPEIKQVIYNNPATIIIWKDGSKTVVKTHNEEFSEENGFAMAYLKKIFGGRNQYLKIIEEAQRPEIK